MINFRVEKDSMGEVNVPSQFYYGAQTMRAYDNFNISDLKMPISLLKALTVIKMSAAKANSEICILKDDIAKAIEKSCKEILDDKYNDNFPLDVYQTGSGTSWNMNINEVIANRSAEILGGKKGDKSVHPNDHVNLGQSSNDVIPTAMNIAAYLDTLKLIDSLDVLINSINLKCREFSKVYKIGRTHLQDAVPMTLAQEFSSWKQQVINCKNAIKDVLPRLSELAIGGTAIGTGINTHAEFSKKIVKNINSFLGLKFKNAPNFFEAISARDSIVALSGSLNSLAVSLMKIGNDVRLLSSGPRCGFGEINLPSLQPGSSIMPGKINPVIPEALIQVCASVIGKNVTLSIAGQSAPLQLNIMQPLMCYEILEMLKILNNVVLEFSNKCVKGITANVDKCEESIQWSLALVTPLALKIGYDKAAQIAYKAFNEKITVKEAALKYTDISEKELKQIFAIDKMM